MIFFKILSDQKLHVESILIKIKIDFLQLYYEQDLEADPRMAYDKRCDYCRTESIETEIKRRKIAKRDFLNEPKNPDLLIKHLKGTRYEWMLQS